MGLVVLLLVLAASMQPVSQALGDTTKIPDGYATIQAAIEAAGDGDTILVVEGRYQGNLSVTEGITLSGSWDPT